LLTLWVQEKKVLATTFRDYLAEAKSSVTEVSVDELVQEALSNTELIIVDVREKDEHEQGVVPGAKLIPRGLLEMKIENLAPKSWATAMWFQWPVGLGNMRNRVTRWNYAKDSPTSKWHATVAISFSLKWAKKVR
jgi:rhodanese-related sulfurtransferase